MSTSQGARVESVTASNTAAIAGAIALGDQVRGTLGFMPFAAYYEADEK